MAKKLTKTGITTGNTVRAFHVTQSVDAFTGTDAYDISLSGSLNVTGSIFISGDNISISASHRIYGSSFIGENADIQTLENSSGTTITIADSLYFSNSNANITCSGNYSSSGDILFNPSNASTGTSVLTIDPTTGKVFRTGSYGGSSGGGSTSAAGNNYEIQFNSASTFQATSSLKFNYLSQSLEQGYQVEAKGLHSHAEGGYTLAAGNVDHAEGYETTASSVGWPAGGGAAAAAHAEGYHTIAYGIGAHAEGYATIVSASSAHAEGAGTLANGTGSHAEGYKTTASGDYSHTAGWETYATGSGIGQSVIGWFNEPVTGNGDFIIGNGTSNGSRSNLLHASGNLVAITGSLIVSGSSPTTVTFGNSLQWSNPNASLTFTGSMGISGSLNTNGTITMATASIGGGIFTSASLAAGGGGGGSTFPYSGSAQITGSLGITGSFGTIGNGTLGVKNIIRLSDDNAPVQIGYGAGESDLSHWSITLVGTNAGGQLGGSEGEGCTYIGHYAGYSADEGTHNTLMGVSAGVQMSNTSNTTAIGASAMSSTHLNGGGTPNYSVALGGNALSRLHGERVIGIGYNVGSGRTTGDKQIFIGNDAGTMAAASGDPIGHNIFIGAECGYNVTGSNNLMIGHSVAYTGSSYLELDNQLRIGSGSIVPISASLVTGDIIFPSTASAAYFSGDGSQLTNLPASSTFPFTGDAVITGSLIVNASSSTSQSLSIIGSGSTVFDVIGSVGTLFSVDDDLTGTLFTANDISGFPVLEASASGEVFIGKSPQSLYTTAVISATSASNSQSLCTLSTSSYDGAFFEFTCISASNTTVGSMISTWNGGTVSSNEYATSSIGTTYRSAGLDLQVIISQSQAQLVAITDSTSPNTWKVKTIIKSI